jgi:TRAP transporter 4TM/12TM fusion protein
MVVSFALAAFQLYTAGVSMLTSWVQRDVHIMFIMLLTLMIFPFTKRGEKERITLLDLVFIVLTLSCTWYILLNYQQIVLRLGSPTIWDIVFGIIMVLMLTEVCRRSMGWVIVVIAWAFILYVFAGPWIPGLLGHRGYSISRLISQLYLTTEGIFGLPLGVSANYIFLFIFLAALLSSTGMGRFLLDLAMAIMGRYTGGTGKTAIFAGGLMGTITGSAVADIAGTGSITIPMMIQTGYSRVYAGAIAAVGSSGGQIMPPVMGAAAFIIAEFLQIPYIEVCICACIPALLYYFGGIMAVHFHSAKSGLVGMPKERLPQLKAVLKEGGHLLIPLAILIYFLAIARVTPIRAGFYAVLSIFLVAFFRQSTYLTLPRLVNAVVEAAKNTISVAVACAMAGIVIGVFNLTGLGLRLSSAIVDVSGENLLIALLLTMVICLIMGMGVPTTAAYIIVGTMVAPALVKMGLLPIAAHLFVFYFAIISAITPPVALAAYAAGGIAQENPMRIGWTACRIAIPAFIVPFLFCYNPAIIAQAGILEILWRAFMSVVAVTALAACMEGFFARSCNRVERLMFGASAILLIFPTILTDILGVALLAGAIALNLRGTPGRKEIQVSSVQAS